MTDRIFDQWVLGGSRAHTSRHAVKRLNRSVDGPVPGAYIIVSLCGIRGDAYGLLHATNTLFDPAALHAAGREVCSKCERKWAMEQPSVPGWNRACVTCGTDQPINFFGIDKRTRDGMAKTCTPCIDAARRAVAAAQRIAEQAAETERVLVESAQRSEQRLAALRRYQDSSLTPTLTCNSGHRLVPVPALVPASHLGRFAGAEFPGEGLSCPCGTVVLAAVGAKGSAAHPALGWSAILNAVRALDEIASTPIPASIDVAAASGAATRP